MIYGADQVKGHIIDLKTTNPKHITGEGIAASEKKNTEQSFGELLVNAFNGVNDLQVKGSEMSEQMITSPESLNVHDVMIALAEANLSLSMTKAIVDRAIRAYNEILIAR